MEKLDRARVEVDFKPESGISSPSDYEREMLLRRSLEEVVLLTRYPRCVVSVVVQVRGGGRQRSMRHLSAFHTVLGGAQGNVHSHRLILMYERIVVQAEGR